MTAQQLKSSILQMAVQGKLVPQNPNDEPASVLLERIKAEKQELIRQGKIKKDKKKSDVIKMDEVPFEIPDSWEWVKICDLYSILNGDRGKNYPSKDKLKKNGIPFISAVNLDGKTVIEDDNLLCVSEEQYGLLNNGKLVKDDIVVCIRGSLGKHGKFQFDKGAIASSLVILRPYYNIRVLSDFLMLYLDTPLFFSEIKKYDNGTAQPNLAAKSLEQFFIPLPPLNEQSTILTKLEELLPYIEAYEKAETQLTALNKSFPEMLKKSILQEAVQGKLVPQNPDDEPAGVLLERIKAEKQELIRQGKIKKDKKKSDVIKMDEVPFEIPDSWEWVRFSSVIELQSGQDLTPDKYNANEKGLPYITGASNIENENVIINRWTENGKSFAYKGDILLTCKGTVGTMAILQQEQVHIARQIMAIRPYNEIYTDYIKLVLETLVENLKSVAKSMIPGITRDNVLLSLIPLPPLEEQKRIVEKIEELMKYCKML